VLEFAETPLFSKILERYLSDEEYAELQAFLSEHPEAGEVVRGSGGVRKLRWAVKGRGKRGGLRVIYYLWRAQGQIWLLTLYSKNVKETIPAHVLRKIKEAIDDDV
jgi:mRNA-degrading endonuclease RelE of RelBE toxin-antitoxin system